MTRDELRNSLSCLCKQLKLSQRMIDRCKEETDPALELFLYEILKEEIDHRARRRLARQLNQASFPYLKHLDDFDDRHVKYPANISLNDLCSLNFLQKSQNIILYGPVGTGKTHLAISLGYRACQEGYKVRFFTLADLIAQLSKAEREGQLESLLLSIGKLDLLILDEWGYVPVDRIGSQHLFRIISDCYERKSLILTTNIEFSAWASIFTDEQMASAMIDRLVHHGHLIVCDGPSYRITHALMRQNKDGGEV